MSAGGNEEPAVPRCATCRGPMAIVPITHKNGRTVEHHVCPSCHSGKELPPDPPTQRQLRVVR
jgi:Zn finger protein HypA/HybF involved in hydrogenase expression